MSRGQNEELSKMGKNSPGMTLETKDKTAPVTEDDTACSRCESPIDTTGSPPWCKKCRAKYQREYQTLRKQMSESRGYAAGVAAMRDAIAAEFDRMGRQTYSAFSLAQWVRKFQISESPQTD